MTTEWFYFKGEDRFGPLGSQQLKALADTGGLVPTDRVWKDGMAAPVPAAKLTGLFSTAKESPSSSASTSEVAALTNTSVAASSAPEQSGGLERVWAVGVDWYIGYVMSIGRLFRPVLTFAGTVATAMWDVVVHMLSVSGNRLEKFNLNQRVNQAQVTLGETLFAANLGDVVIRSRIVEKDQAIQAADANQAPTAVLAADRRLLLKELACKSDLESVAHLDVERDRQALKAADEAVVAHEKQVADEIAARRPVDWPRASLGAFAVVLLFVIAAANKEPKVTVSDQAQSADVDHNVARGGSSAFSTAGTSYTASKGFLKGKLTVELTPSAASEIRLRDFKLNGNRLEFLLTNFGGRGRVNPWHYAVFDAEGTKLEDGAVMFGHTVALNETTKASIFVGHDNVDAAVKVVVHTSP